MCDFCGPVFGEREIYQDERFRVVVSLGPFVVGWLLVIPKIHILALSQMTPELERKYEQAASRFRSLLQSHYGPVAEFEHGPAECDSSVGCTIDHAHSHLVPTTINLLDSAHILLPTANWIKLNSVTDLSPWHEANRSYLFLRQNGKVHATIAPTFPSQFFRRVLASKLGIDEFDWRRDQRQREILATIAALATPAA